MVKPQTFLAVEDVVMEKPEKPLVVESQIQNTGLSDEDLAFLNSFDEKAKTKIYRKVSCSPSPSTFTILTSFLRRTIV